MSVFVFLFILFFSGQTLQANLLELSDNIYQSEWYRYPRSVQRCVPIMMMQAQHPFHLSIYGVLTLRLPNYVEVRAEMDKYSPLHLYK